MKKLIDFYNKFADGIWLPKWKSKDWYENKFGIVCSHTEMYIDYYITREQQEKESLEQLKKTVDGIKKAYHRNKSFPKYQNPPPPPPKILTDWNSCNTVTFNSTNTIHTGIYNSCTVSDNVANSSLYLYRFKTRLKSGALGIENLGLCKNDVEEINKLIKNDLSKDIFKNTNIEIEYRLGTSPLDIIKTFNVKMN